MFHQILAYLIPKVKWKERVGNMALVLKRIFILCIMIAAGAVLGRLAFRAVLNFLLGGTMFGGNFL